MDRVLQEVKAERKRQDAKWGADRDLPLYEWVVIMAEEVGEVSSEALTLVNAFGHDKVAALERAYAEGVQVAAVAVAMCESLKRRLAEFRELGYAEEVAS